MLTKRTILWAITAGVVAWSMNAYAGRQIEFKSGIVWPEPKVVTPGKTDAEPPADAIVLFDGKDLSKWLYQGDRSTDRPADLGYWMGYRICEAYYKRAADKKQAIREILEIKDFEAFRSSSNNVDPNSNDDSKRPLPGELHLTSLFGASPNAADYLLDPYLNTQGRLAYKKVLLEILRDLTEKQEREARRR